MNRPFTYPQALEYIASTGRFGIKMGLDRTRALLDAVGAPDRGMRGALVAGTNGKGSTCAVLASIMRTAGLRVAEMPKPHLVSYTERVVVDARPISERMFARAVTAMVAPIEAVTPAHGAPTEFEILTAMALRFARNRRADLLVCEVGMGGRLDATNVTNLGVKVITSIDLDHQRYLGDTIAQIAAEKAGIIAPGDIVIAGPLAGDARDVVEARCREMGAELLLATRDFTVTSLLTSWEGTVLALEAAPGGWIRSLPRLATSLLGPHQAQNAAVAAVAAQAIARRQQLDLTDTAIREGIAATRWPGRLERFSGNPDVVIDGGHNPAAVSAVTQAIAALGTEVPPVLLFGAMADKDLAGMVALLPLNWAAVFTQVPEERAVPAAALLEVARGMGRDADEASPDLGTALQRARARAGQGGVVLVLGSLYLAGAVRALLVANPAIVEAWP